MRRTKRTARLAGLGGLHHQLCGSCGQRIGRGAAYPVHDILRFVAANPGVPLFKIADALGIPQPDVYIVACSRWGVSFLERLKNDRPPFLEEYRLPE